MENNRVTTFVVANQQDAIVLLCIAALGAGTALSFLHRAPSAQRLKPSWQLRAVSSFTFGVGAFLLAIMRNEALLVSTPFWVCGAAWLGPALLNMVYAYILRVADAILGINNER